MMVLYVRSELASVWFVWGPVPVKALSDNFALSECHWFVPGMIGEDG